MKKAVLLIIALTLAFGSARAQELSKVRLISKIDIKEHYKLWDGQEIALMGYTSKLSDTLKLPSPVLTVNEGDSVELHMYNFSQGAPHTIHLHGLDVDQANDGVPGLSSVVPHGESFYYRFKSIEAFNWS